MAVTFQDYFTTSTTITLYGAKLQNGKKSTNKITAVKSASPVIVRLGSVKTVTLTGIITSTTDYDILDGFDGETVLHVTASTYKGLPVNSNWLCTAPKLIENAGNLSRWEYTLELTSYGTRTPS